MRGFENEGFAHVVRPMLACTFALYIVQATALQLDVDDPFDVPQNLSDIADLFNSFVDSNMPDVKIRARAIPGLRIGAVATRPISVDTLYIRVPNSAILDTRRIANARPLRGALSALDGSAARKESITELLMTFIYERFVLGSKSFWWPYFVTIPNPAELDAAPLWDSALLTKELAQFPSLRSEIKRSLQQYENAYRATSSAIASALRSSSTSSAAAEVLSAVTHDRYLYAYFLLDSRSIWWGPEGRHLVPMLDLINCRSHGRPHFTRAAPSGAAVGGAADTFATANYAVGEEVYENYGQPSSTYLHHHGFALAANSHDCVDVPMPYTVDLSVDAPPPLPNDKLRTARAAGHSGVRPPKGQSDISEGRGMIPPKLCVGYPRPSRVWKRVGGPSRSLVSASDVATWPEGAVRFLQRVYTAAVDDGVDVGSGANADASAAAQRYIVRYVAALYEALAGTYASDLDTLHKAGAPSGFGKGTDPPLYTDPPVGGAAVARAGAVDCDVRGLFCGFRPQCGEASDDDGDDLEEPSDTLHDHPLSSALPSEYDAMLSRSPSSREVGAAAFRMSQRHVCASILKSSRGTALVTCVKAEVALARAARAVAFANLTRGVYEAVASEARSKVSRGGDDGDGVHKWHEISRAWSDAESTLRGVAANAAEKYKAAFEALTTKAPRNIPAKKPSGSQKGGGTRSQHGAWDEL